MARNNSKEQLIRPLFISEVVARVFLHLDNRSLARCARTCRAWHTPALETLWGAVDNVAFLFQLITSTFTVNGYINDEYGEWGLILTLERDLQPPDWDRFSHYASHVKSLSIPGFNAIKPELLAEVCRSRLVQNLFPGLQHLEFSVTENTLKYSVLFLQSSLKSIAVSLTNRDVSVDRLFFQEVARRSPGIETLTINTKDPSILRIGDGLTMLLKALKRLRNVSLPPYSLTSDVLSSLSTVPLLETVGANPPPVKINYGSSVSSLQPLDLVLSPGAFPSLKHFSIHSSFSNLEQILKSQHAPAHLTSLSIQTTGLEHAATLRKLISQLTASCPMLKSLALNLVVDSSTVIGENLNSPERISFSDFRGIGQLSHLVEFHINHFHPLIIGDAEVSELAKSWPKAEVVSLNPVPISSEKPELTPGALVSCLHQWKKLRSLEMYIDFTSSSLSNTCSHPNQPGSVAPLEHLSLGTSPLTKPKAVAVFLSNFCSPNCVLSTEVHWLSFPSVFQSFPSGLQSYMKEMNSAWEKVWDILPVLVEVRMEERKARKE